MLRKSREARQRELPRDADQRPSLRSAAMACHMELGQAPCGWGARMTTGEIPFRKAYLGSIVDPDRGGRDAEIHIVGRKGCGWNMPFWPTAPPFPGFAVLHRNGAPDRMKLRTPMLLRLRSKFRTLAEPPSPLRCRPDSDQDLCRNHSCRSRSKAAARPSSGMVSPRCVMAGASAASHEAATAGPIRASPEAVPAAAV
jgi:hypothetical protein